MSREINISIYRDTIRKNRKYLKSLTLIERLRLNLFHHYFMKKYGKLMSELSHQ